MSAVTLVFDLFLIGSGMAVVAWMVHEYQQSVAENDGRLDRRFGVSEAGHRDVVPLAVAASARPRATHAPCGEITYSALASRAKRAARPAEARSARAASGRASALRFEHRG